jgi:protein-disulfide isomerase
VSLLIADISFEGAELEEARLGILSASIVASLLGWGVFTVVHRMSVEARRRAATGLAPPILDLTPDVDPEVNHIRGPVDAPVTLVEYGDFECPYCGQAEPVIRELVQRFGDDLRFVFRHLPLVDVHEHASAAAEAAEAAGEQGRFWEMHDMLFANQDALIYPDLMRFAAELGLDVERFGEDLRGRRHSARISRDVESADASGAAGTPTMFVDGRRHRAPTTSTPSPQPSSAASRPRCDRLPPADARPDVLFPGLRVARWRCGLKHRPSGRRLPRPHRDHRRDHGVRRRAQRQRDRPAAAHGPHRRGVLPPPRVRARRHRHRPSRAGAGVRAGGDAVRYAVPRGRESAISAQNRSRLACASAGEPTRALRHHRWVRKWIALSTAPLRLPCRGGHGSTPTP